MVNRPSWAKPVKLDSNIALKPHMEVSMPRRRVGQMRGRVAAGSAPGAVCVRQVDSVVDGLADQRHPEAQGDAVHEAERQADGRRFRR